MSHNRQANERSLRHTASHRALSLTALIIFSFTSLLLSACAPSAHATTAYHTPTTTSAPASGPTDTPHALQVERQLHDLAPARLVIPQLSLDAPILALDPDPNGAMQAPRVPDPHDPIWGQVYWWDVGAAPGHIGNAVIAGHVNRPDASPSTFTHLDRLHPGDTFQLITISGRRLTFVVTAQVAETAYVHGGSDPTIQRIFGPASTPNLNLITCWGNWDGQQFDHRLVIYSTLQGASPYPPNTTAS